MPVRDSNTLRPDEQVTGNLSVCKKDVLKINSFDKRYHIMASTRKLQ